MDTPDFVVFTGGPGAGKTTLIGRLREFGHRCVDEAARTIIRDQAAIGGRARHGADNELFAEVSLSWEIRNYREAAGLPGPVFFDRGVPDLIGYHLLLGHAVPPHVTEAARRFRYHRSVFIAPPWPEIYVQDRERTHDLDEAIRGHGVALTAYQACGYELITLPKSDVDDRVSFVLSHLDIPQRTNHRPTA
jgi:predicted ATPase